MKAVCIQVLAALVLSQRLRSRTHLPLQMPSYALLASERVTKPRCRWQDLQHASPSPTMGKCVRGTKAASEPSKSVHVGLGGGSPPFRTIFLSVLKTSAWAQQMRRGAWARAAAFRSSSWSPLGHPAVPTALGNAGGWTTAPCFWQLGDCKGCILQCILAMHNLRACLNDPCWLLQESSQQNLSHHFLLVKIHLPTTKHQ